MNLLYTTVAYQTLESQHYVEVWRSRRHIVEQMPIERVTSYLRVDPASSLALIDAIVCAADAGLVAFDSDMSPLRIFPLEEALKLAEDVRGLPNNCAMRDGRKWRSIPFVIFCNSFELGAALLAKTHAQILRSMHPMLALNHVRSIVDEYQERVLQDYENVGILVRLKSGRTQIGPALQRKGPDVETEYYYAPADRRNNQTWLTVKRDNEGLRQDVELFQMLLDRNATETEMHRFFEQHPAILMEARMGIPISHRPNFANPKDCKPDFVLSPILGPLDDGITELLELKGPAEKTLTQGLHRGFTAKVHRAVDQVRDYGRYLRDPANLQAILRALGYVPDNSRLAVLIGRAPKSPGEIEALMQRRGELDVRVVTYDEILETQANQLDLKSLFEI